MVEIRGDKARLYFSAPRHVEIVRAELEGRPIHDD
jgi:sRNA-binding carbon storage regulator CsrA